MIYTTTYRYEFEWQRSQLLLLLLHRPKATCNFRYLLTQLFDDLHALPICYTLEQVWKHTKGINRKRSALRTIRKRAGHPSHNHRFETKHQWWDLIFLHLTIWTNLIFYPFNYFNLRSFQFRVMIITIQKTHTTAQKKDIWWTWEWQHHIVFWLYGQVCQAT